MRRLDYNKYLRDLRILNSFRTEPSIDRTAKRVGMSPQQVRNWLVDATYRYPIYEDDDGKIYVAWRLR